MFRVSVEPEMLHWALERSYKPVKSLTKRFPKLPQWLAGEARPTYRQLQDFADRTATPFGYFFLSAPPDERLPLPDFRTMSDRPVERPSADLLDTIGTMQQRQDWLRDTLIEEDAEPLPFVGSANLESDAEAVARDMRRVLGLTDAWANAIGTWRYAVSELRRRCEAAGILAVINGVVGNNTRRVLSVGEFRGFALSDAYAPLIFVNGADFKSAQMFTLAHELAHIWLGRDGISGFETLNPSGSTVEVLCNKAAAEFLVPAEELRKAWAAKAEDFEALARHFKVSPIVTARRAMDLRLIPREDFFAFYKAYTTRERTASKKTQGGDFYNNQNTRVGVRFATEVIRAAKEGRLLYRDAYRLTGLNGKAFSKYAEHLGFNML